MNTEKEYLSKYSIENFDRPSVATDIVVFALHNEDRDSFRKDPEVKLSILLIERGEHPFKGKWALPGGFVKMDETVEQGALREVCEETGIAPSTLIYNGVFSDIDRDPRGRIISNAFTCIFSETPEVKAGTDAKSTRFFDISFDTLSDNNYLLKLKSDDIVLSSEVCLEKTSVGTLKLNVKNEDILAFDHVKIIFTALKQLKERAEKFELIFSFLPKKFTLTSLQKVQETLTGAKSVPANFRRKVSEFVKETGEYTQGAGHRPAMLYTKK